MVMNILLSIALITMPIFESSSIKELKGKWTAGIRLDNAVEWSKIC